MKYLADNIDQIKHSMLQDILKTVLQSSNEEFQLITSHSKHTQGLPTGKKLSGLYVQKIKWSTGALVSGCKSRGIPDCITVKRCFKLGFLATRSLFE